MNSYQICSKCVMDTSDPAIEFNADGVCNHCRNFENVIKPNWHPNQEGSQIIEKVAAQMKKECAGAEYDCIMGLSGGIDSSYLAYVAKEILGLRVLAVHVDGGWNSEIAVRNIENVCNNLSMDLYTHVVDWEEMRDVQASFVRAGVANLDVPQDHAFFSALYSYAAKNNFKYVLSGSNFATEGILPNAWGYMAMDLKHLEGIHRVYGKRQLKTYPKTSLFKYLLYYPYIKKMKVVKPLNFMPYNKDEAMAFLIKNLGWEYYGGKHFESRFTKFFQAYYLPTKFGYDKRRAHLSSLIVSGQLSREEALSELDKPLYSEEQLQEDKEYVLRKLEISEVEFDEIMNAPSRSFKDFSSNYAFLNSLRNLRDFFNPQKING